MRFPFRREFIERPMEDHELFLRHDGRRPAVFIIEAKKSRCELNGPWTDRAERNIQRVLSAVGIFPPEKLEAAATALYDRDSYSSSEYGSVSLVAVGDEYNVRWHRERHKVEQLLWNGILDFIYDPMTNLSDAKKQHDQWDDFGQKLYHRVTSNCDCTSFVKEMRIELGLPDGSTSEVIVEQRVVQGV
jgi:hypothetical protein